MADGLRAGIALPRVPGRVRRSGGAGVLGAERTDRENLRLVAGIYSHARRGPHTRRRLGTLRARFRRSGRVRVRSMPQKGS